MLVNKLIKFRKSKSWLRQRSKPIDFVFGGYTKRVPNKDFVEKSTKEWNVSLFVRSLASSIVNRDKFNNLKYFCIFLGYSRSGHSIIGSLLDAHENIMIGHEVDVVYLSNLGFSKKQIYSIVFENSRRFAKFGRGWSGYSYQPKNSFQGRYNKSLEILGDKNGGWTTHLLFSNPNALDNLKRIVDINIKYIHHIRNPFDNISRIEINKGRKKVGKNSVDYYFALNSAIAKYLKNVKKENYFQGRHEDFIVEPETYLERMCVFLNVDCKDRYLRSCSAIVKSSVSRPRFDIHWDKKLVDYTMKNMGKYKYLEGYRF